MSTLLSFKLYYELSDWTRCEKTLFRQLENSKTHTNGNNSRQQSSEEVSSSEKAPRQISSRGRVFVFTSYTALCPRVITFRGSLTPDNYSAVVVNFPRNKRRRPLRWRRRRETQYRVAVERRYQSCDFHQVQRRSVLARLPVTAPQK